MMTPMTTDEAKKWILTEFSQVASLCDMSTEAPWKWCWPLGGRPELVAPKYHIVMDFVRMGMAGAAPRFSTRWLKSDLDIMSRMDALMEAPARGTPDCRQVANIDAQFIADSRLNLENACRVIDALIREN